MTIPDVLPVVRKLYRREPAGCCWHVVLDDGNVVDDTVLWCKTQRLKLGRFAA